MVSTGTLIFSSALFGLILSVLLSIIGAGFIITMIHSGSMFLAVAAMPLLLIGVAGCYFLYGWFTEGVK